MTKYLSILLIITTIIFTSCNTENKVDKPSVEVMKECLTNELGASVKILGYEHQDGINKEIDGVKFYDAYFNAEVKFLSNIGRTFEVGDEYKLVKVAVQLMKTEKGWNCQEYDWSNVILVKINKGARTDNENVSGQVFRNALKQPSENQFNNSNQPTTSASGLKYSEVSRRIIFRTELSSFSSSEL